MGMKDALLENLGRNYNPGEGDVLILIKKDSNNPQRVGHPLLMCPSPGHPDYRPTASFEPERAGRAMIQAWLEG